MGRATIRVMVRGVKVRAGVSVRVAHRVTNIVKG